MKEKGPRKNKQARKISLVFAMASEAQPLIDALNLTPANVNTEIGSLPFRYFAGVWKGLEITLASNGKDSRFGVDQIGSEPAAVNAFLTRQLFHPDIIASIGTAGGLTDLGAKTGEVFLGNKQVFFHDHRIPLPGMREFGLGAYPSLDMSEIGAHLGLRIETISSRNSLDFNVTDLEALKKNHAHIEEMEAAAIAWVCFITKTPFFAIKAITNVFCETASAANDFEHNLRVAVASLCANTVRVLEVLSGDAWDTLLSTYKATLPK